MAITTETELSQNAHALWLKALTAVERRNYAYAISLIQAVLKEAPEFLEGRKLLRRSALAHTKGKKSFFGGFSTTGLKGGQVLKKDPAAALEMAEKILEGDPHNVQGNTLLKDAALALNYYETAIFALETMADANPKDTKALHELGDLLYQRGDAARAVDVYTRISAINPADLVALKRGKDAAAANTMKSGGWETAKDYRDLIKNKEEAVLLEQKNRVVKDEDVIATQLRELHAQLEAEPQNVDVARKIAGLYEQSKDYTTAITFYDYANNISGGGDQWLLRKISDLSLKQLEESILERKEWLKLAGDEHEDSERVKQEIADLAKQQREWLLNEARKRVERNPTDLQFRYELAEQLILNEEFTAAIPELQKARNHANVRTRAMNLLGQCYVGKGMYDLAVKTFRETAGELLEMDATKKDILYRLGEAYERLSKKEESLECFKQIYEADYGYRDVAQRVESSYGG